jgi:LmbE family N-acetylglucosaminyl deacetylase
LIDFFSKLKPNNILMPFRYDRHPDHVALHRATLQALECLTPRIQVLEYFVYYRWKLLPEKDVRKYVRPDHLIAVNIQAGSESKRRALDCFQSQTTKFFPWQYRPNLTRAFLDEVCREPELFLRHDPSFPERSIFTRAHTWIRVAHVAEPLLKRWKDEARIVLHARGRQDKPKA